MVSSKFMPFAIRPMSTNDIPQAIEIEHQVFPAIIPPTAFRFELGKSNSSYLVAFSIKSSANHQAPTVVGGSFPKDISGIRGLPRKIREGFRKEEELVAGFLGLWYVVDEAHIMSVGVRETLRRRGIGELLLLSAIKQAISKNASEATLEVRTSNTSAINLYEKYGFTRRGIRKAYYADNQEDAIIMTTDSIQHPDYRERFVTLEDSHQDRWGTSRRTFM